MKQANEITEELRSMGSILADLPRTMPYTTPAGYFTDIAGSVRTTIDYLNEVEHVPDWGKTMPFTIPENYFKELPDDIKANGAVSELSKTTPYAVPPDYFAGLPSKMLEAAKATDAAIEQPKVIPLKRVNKFRSFHWAAAAVLFLTIGFGAYETFFTAPQPDPENMLSSVPGNDIEDYVERIYRIDGNRIASNSEINNIQLENKDIIEYLDETGWD